MDTATETTGQNPSPTEDEIRQVNAAISLLPRVRALKELLDLVDRQPVFPNIADTRALVKTELEASERDVLDALTGTHH